MNYQDFLAAKNIRPSKAGFTVPAAAINPLAFDWQREIVAWAIRCGRAALFEDCGLGKTLQQLLWAEQVHKHTGKPVILLCPLAVQWQTKREAERFGIDCRVEIAEAQDDAVNGITITNYEKLHHFKPGEFVGVVLDESSVLKAYTGATKRMLCDGFRDTPYKLACTATPAPNDRMELGNHSEFLGVMPSDEMLAVWFINDGGKAGNYRLRKHAERHFWRWMSSWSVCISSPADIGFSADGYVLPPLNTHEHVIECKPQDGYLFAVPRDVSATDVHKEKRAYLDERADAVGELVSGSPEAWTVWCDTDYEADALKARIPDAIEVRGSHKTADKERMLRAFSDGQERVIITKPEIGGFGLNWQHCHKTTWFAGYSYERFYQCIRRLLRFGQKNPVDVHIVRTVNEGSIVDTLREKERLHVEMQREMALLMAEGMKEELGLGLAPRKYVATVKMEPPNWLTPKA